MQCCPLLMPLFIWIITAELFSIHNWRKEWWNWVVYVSGKWPVWASENTLIGIPIWHILSILWIIVYFASWTIEKIYPYSMRHISQLQVSISQIITTCNDTNITAVFINMRNRVSENFVRHSNATSGLPWVPNSERLPVQVPHVSTLVSSTIFDLSVS